MNETAGKRGVLQSGARRWRLGVAVVAWAGGAGWLLASGSIAAQEDRSARALARDFRSEDGKRVIRALVAFQRMPMEDRSPELRQALVDAVVREETKDPPVLAGTEQFASLVESVLELGEACDPVALPAIVLFPMSGVGVYETLFRFGHLGLDAVLREMSRADVEGNAYKGGLKALAYFADQWGVAALDEATYAAMVGHARRALEFPYFHGSGWPLSGAIFLAAVLEAPELTALLLDLAESPEALQARGVAGGRTAETIHERAQEAVEGRLVPYWRDFQRPRTGPSCH